MTPRPRHTKTDSNHAEFSKLRDFGFLMIDIHDLGGWALDWLCIGAHRDGRVLAVMIEVKPDEDAPFTNDEQAVLIAWPEVTMIAYRIEDVLRRYGRIE